MKIVSLLLLTGALALPSITASGAPDLGSAAAGLTTLQIGMVKTNQALVADMDRKGRALELSRVMLSLNKKLHAALTQQRKFNVLARADLKVLLDEQDLGSAGGGIIDPATAAEKGAIKGAQYSAVLEINHFLDQTQTAAFATGRSGYRRRLQMAGVLTIANSSTGDTLDASDVKVETNAVRITEVNIAADGEQSDELLNDVATDLAQKVAQRTVEVIFPIKVMDREDNTVTVNRGDNSGIQLGEILTAYGPSKVITDPESGQKIQRKGVKIGSVKVTSVEPTYLQAEVFEEKEPGKSVAKGAVLSRLPATPASP
jgi:curli biogenesis system outer membrane secretion channel CsgG